ncbi:MAG: hypothetical protein V1773_17250 [bacterium]
MQVFKVLLMIYILLNVKMYAQETECKQTNQNNTKFKFYFLNGYGAIYQSDLSENTFYRLHVDITADISENSTGNTIKLFDEFFFFVSKEIIKTKEFSIKLAPEYGINIINKKHATLYVGAGPYLMYGYLNKNTDISLPDDSGVISISNNNLKNITNTYSAGIILFTGIEGKINDNFSVFAEFSISGFRTWEDIETNALQRYYNQKSKETNIKIWDYEFSKVKLGVSIIF